MGFFKKKDKTTTLSVQKNWYVDRYQTAIVQRNFLALLVLLCLASIVVMVFKVVQVSTSKSIEPFVVEIEEKTGITSVIRPFVKEELTSNQAINRYFIWKYLNARESYDYHQYQYNHNTVVRLLSTASVYREFRKETALTNPSSPLRLGEDTTRSIQIISQSELDSSQKQKTLLIRFARKTTDRKGYTNTTKHIATLTYTISNLRLTREEREINPLGFQVLKYKVEDEAKTF